MLILLASLFLTEPAPLEMPRAQAYLVEEAGAKRLEDRYATFDLWVSQASLGRWFDADGRVFSLYSLAVLPPPVAAEAMVSRSDYAMTRTGLDRRDVDRRRASIALLSPVGLRAEGAPPRQLPRGFKDVDYWQEATNRTAVVCAFRPEKCDIWYLAVWELAEGDDFFAQVDVFERGFLGQEFAAVKRPSALPPRHKVRTSDPSPGPRDLLRADIRHAVTNYPNWHVTDGETFTVVDDLPRANDFALTLTNEMPRLHARYAAAFPSSLDMTNALCVVRIFATRDEYVDALSFADAEDMAWSAAYWSTLRRELVAYLPEGGARELLKTVRHEAFHQYLSYAAAMIPASPWLNEGYAQYFEDTESREWGEGLSPTPEDLTRLSDALPGLLAMDYAQFYDGTDDERRLKYRLAWSVAVFLEKGAPKVRFDPFKNLKRDYLSALLKTQDMKKATTAAFGTSDALKLFVAEWLKFWKP